MLEGGFLRSISRSIRGDRGLGPDHQAPDLDEVGRQEVAGDGIASELADADRSDDAATAKRRAIKALSDALSPSHPVEDRSHLFGRERELRQLFHAIADLRAHAFIHGARGAGKTSLARAFGDFADERGLVVIYLSCEDSSSFADIFRPYLDFLPDSCFTRDRVEEARRAIDRLPADFRPRALAGILSLVTEQRTVLIVDEFDRVADSAVRDEVATLLKLMSDMRAQVHLLLVGIARDARGLVEGHESLKRHLVAVALGKFGDASAAALLDDAERRADLRFDPAARRLVISLAAGSPYHLRLFAFCAGMVALEGDLHEVTPSAVVQGLRVAFDNWGELNPSDAQVLTWAAARGPSERRAIEALALAALESPVFTRDTLAHRLVALGGGEDSADAALQLLSPALEQDGEGAWQFRDSLAPQFLLLACCFAADRAEAEGARR